jgi:Skp family chaperone for outer membrane proteins
MKHHKYIILFLLLISLVPSILLANDKIVYIDINKVINKSNAGLLLIKDIKKLEEINLQNFKKIESQLKSDEKKIISEKNIISAEQFNIKVENFKKEVDGYKDTRQIAINDTRKKSAESTAEFLNKIIGTYASKHSISFVFPKKNILIAKSEFDITDKIIVLVNQNIDKIAIK